MLLLDKTFLLWPGIVNLMELAFLEMQIIPSTVRQLENSLSKQKKR